MVLNHKNQLVSWSNTHNFNWLVGFHNYVRGLLKDQLQDLGKCENKNIENKLHKNAIYDYDRMLHIYTLLMMCSYLEEWLYHSRKTYALNIDLVHGEGSIGRFKNVVKQLGVDLSSRLWQEVKNVEEVRNCLLHANGRISLFKHPQKIKKIIKRKNSGLEIIRDCLIISEDYLQRFNKTISDLLDIMYQKGD